jgi:hypothetical protein
VLGIAARVFGIDVAPLTQKMDEMTMMFLAPQDWEFVIICKHASRK